MEERKKKGRDLCSEPVRRNCNTDLWTRESIEMFHAAGSDGHGGVEFLAYRREGQKSRTES